jgi:hypothetical protein
MDGMTEFEKLLYKELQEIRKELGALRTSLAVHKVKSGLWGTLGGAVTAVLALAGAYIKSRF